METKSIPTKGKGKNGLSKRQKAFVKEYAKTGNATQAIIDADYDVKDRNVARAMGTENLAKPAIKQSLAEAIPNELLTEKHIGLFHQKQLAYFVFPKNMEDYEIKSHVISAGLELIVIRLSDKGKLAFYSIDDPQAIAKAIAMGYDLKGANAPTKSINLNIETTISDPEVELARKNLLEIKKKKLLEQINARHNDN
jgi:hypothetical protein